MHWRRNGRRRPVRRHAVRRGALRYPFLRDDPGGDVDIEITAGGLCFANDAGRSAPIDWRQIRQVRLFCEPVGPEPSIFAAKDTRPLAYFCELTLRNSKRIMLGNGPLLAPGWSIALRPAYRAFVLELHERLHTARGRTRFRAGSTWRHFLAGHFWSSWEIHGFGYFVLIPRDFAAFRRDFPRRYRPAKVPQRLLPP